MKLKEIAINNYKSLVNFSLKEPNPFLVFAGPNGSGKSNFFEALEFTSYASSFQLHYLEEVFGGLEKILNYKNINEDIKRYSIELFFEEFTNKISYQNINSSVATKRYNDIYQGDLKLVNDKEIEEIIYSAKETEIRTQFFKKFTRLFINKSSINRINFSSENLIAPDASNVAAVLKNLLLDDETRDEIIDWIQLFVPGFDNIEVHSDNIGGTDSLLIYEKGTNKPFTKNLISDGTYNILCLLTAVYQFKEPQFLCIEEPENGLNPYIIRVLVDFFRKQCADKGHYIWLNTHSQTLVKELIPGELVLMDKIDGITKCIQQKDNLDLQGLSMDDAWLSNSLGGGLPW